MLEQASLAAVAPFPRVVVAAARCLSSLALLSPKFGCVKEELLLMRRGARNVCPVPRCTSPAAKRGRRMGQLDHED